MNIPNYPVPIVGLTGYSHFLVRVCATLLKDGYISEVGAGDSTGGRRPRILAVTPGFGRIVGLHVGTVNARAVVTDIAGNVMAFLKAPSLVQSGPDVALPHLTELISKAIAEAGVQVDEVLGIGVGISGISDRSTGTTISWPKVPSWKNVPVLSVISAQFPVPVKLEDTPRAMALAERRFGGARNESDFLYLMIGAGVGSALILGGRPNTGERVCWRILGTSLQIPTVLVCDVRQPGCVETRVSAWHWCVRPQEAISQGCEANSGIYER